MKTLYLCSVTISSIIWFFLFKANSYGQQSTAAAQVQTDTLQYGKTPAEYAPYSRFVKPYKRFFIDTLQYPGYGRHIPEPAHIDTVKLGFIGPIIGFVSESVGGPENIKFNVNENITTWDGYSMSYLAPIGIKMLQGARLAVEQANARGGYRTKIPYKLIIRNDNGSWRSSDKDMTILAWKEKVWAILGTVDGQNSHIAIRVALKAEVPIMNTADTDPTFIETNIPWVFRCITDDRQMCYLLADFAFKKLNLKRVAALRANNRYGRMSIDEFRDAATRLGRPFISELQYLEGDTDFSQQLARIQSLDADGIITYGNVKESALILDQMRKLGMKQWFFGSDRMVTPEFIEIAGEKHGNVAAAYPYDPSRNDPLYLNFIDDFRNRYGEDPEAYAAHAFDGMNMVIAAIEKAGLNRALIRDELAAMTVYQGVTGKKEFDPIFSNRTPAILALLLNGRFEFYNQAEIFSDNFLINK
jgi:ABC-type branched-subunit amino acid transport system substrate-binding protein